jgi:hypothetical protein
MSGMSKVAGFWGVLALWSGLLLTLGPATASQHAPTAEAQAFGRFLASTSPICQSQSSLLCVDSAWRFADHDGDQGLSLDELTEIRDGLRAWLTWKEEEIPLAQRRMVQFGLLLVEGIGLPNLVESYDADGDGTINRTELLSDVRLDARPLGQILVDSDAVDWESLGRRFGPLAGALGGLGAKEPE